MIELAILIIIVVALFKFNSTVNLYSKGAQDTTSGWLEEQLKDNSFERQDRMKEIQNFKEENKITKLSTSEDVLKELGIK